MSLNILRNFAFWLIELIAYFLAYRELKISV